MLRKITIQFRAVISFGIMATIVLLLGLFALTGTNTIRQASREIDEDRLPAIIDIFNFSLEFQRSQTVTARLLLSRTAEAIRMDKLLIEDLEQKIVEAEQKYQSSINSNTEKSLYNDFHSTRLNYRKTQQRVIELAERGQFNEAITVTNNELSNLGQQATSSLKELISFNQQAAAGAARYAESLYERTLWGILLAIGIALVATISLAALLSRSIIYPMNKAVRTAETIADKDLIQPILVDGNDEATRLLNALSRMQQNLQETLQRISSSSSQLASASEDLSLVTKESTRALDQQSQEVEQAATAVNQMTSTVEGVASNAIETSEASREADQLARNGRQQVQQAIQSISGLTEDVTQTATQIETLATKVQEISKVLDVIQTIAEQTNLLALNAAIEAARAGDAGRGFAVVADEVRGLAYRTQQSTKEVEQMIKAIQQGSSLAVTAMQGSYGKAQQTLAIAHNAGQVLDQITGAISRINERNLLIARSSEEQAQVARKVDQSLANIRSLSIQTSAGASQTHAASQELAGLAFNLNHVVAQFRL